MSDLTLENAVSPKFVQALMGHLMKNQQFFVLAEAKIEEKYISDPIIRKIYAICRKFYKKHNRCPTEQELYLEADYRIEDAEHQRAIRSRLVQCSLACGEIDLEVVKRHLTEWYRVQLFYNTLPSVTDTFKQSKASGTFDKVWKGLFDLSKHIQETSFDPPAVVCLDRPEDFFESLAQESKHLVSIGHPLFDKALNENAETGSLRAGEVTVLMGPINVGKTTTLMSVVVHNALIAKKDVLFVGGEGVDSDLLSKMYSCATGISTRDLSLYRKDEKVVSVLGKVAPLLSEKIVLLMDSSKTIEEVEAIIDREQEKRINEKGKGFDLVVYDYLGRLTTKEAQGGKLSRHEALGRVAVSFEALATKHRFHVITPHQVNREGIKINEGKGFGRQDGGQRWLSQSDSGESIEVLKPVANVITINCFPAMRKNNVMAFYIDKCRSSSVGKTFMTQTDFSASRSIYHKAKSFCYHGNTFDGGIMDSIVSEEKQENTHEDEFAQS